MIHVSRRPRAKTARAQGMTEYIILVGLIAILLITAVQRFRGSVDEALQGTTTEVMSIRSGIAMRSPSSNGHTNGQVGVPVVNTTTGTPIIGDVRGGNYTNLRTASGEPYNEATHGAFPAN